MEDKKPKPEELAPEHRAPVDVAPAKARLGFYTRLAQASADRTSTMRQDIEWVMRVAELPDEDIKKDDVPSSAAVGLLRIARADPLEFYKSVAVRLMPKAGEDAGTDMSGGDQQRLIDRARQAADLSDPNTGAEDT